MVKPDAEMQLIVYWYLILSKQQINSGIHLVWLCYCRFVYPSALIQSIYCIGRQINIELAHNYLPQ